MGTGHLEGWGTGSQHLLRPDELVPLEAGRRSQIYPECHMDLGSHVPFMAMWGTRDFETGANLVPTVEELYMSDVEDDDAEKNEFDKIFDLGTFSCPETRLARHCGNVPLKRDEWKPWQVLKTKWDDLSQQDKMDVWWMNHQERLRRQSWTQRDSNDQQGGNQISYTQPIEETDEDDVGGTDNEDDDNGDDSHSHPASPALSLSSSQPAPTLTMAGGSTQASSAAAPTPPLDGSFAGQPMRHPVGPPATAYTIAEDLSSHQQKLIDDCIRWAMREQDEVDAALLEQANMTYEEDEMLHWEQFLASVGAELVEVGHDDHDEHPQQAAQNADQEDDHDTSVLSSATASSSSSSAPSLPTPNAEVVLVPEFGGLDDVLALIKRVQEAEDALAVSLTATPKTPGAKELPEVRVRQAMIERLRCELEAMLKGEVFAIEL